MLIRGSAASGVNNHAADPDSRVTTLTAPDVERGQVDTTLALLLKCTHKKLAGSMAHSAIVHARGNGYSLKDGLHCSCARGSTWDECYFEQMSSCTWRDALNGTDGEPACIQSPSMVRKSTPSMLLT